MARFGWLWVCLALAGAARAQQAAPVDAPAPPADVAASADASVKTLDTVQAVRDDDDQPLDLYRFKNPIHPESNRFTRSWSEPPSPEQAGMGGGYLMMGLGYLVNKAGAGLNQLAGGREQIQRASARPPPGFSDEQIQRAARLCPPQEVYGTSGP